MTSTTAPALPAGSTVLHIGPYKTGTTAMQGALWAAREELGNHGVLYPGAVAHEMQASMAVALGRVDPGGDVDQFRKRWFTMVEAMQAQQAEHGQIGVLSSEVYCGADVEHARTVLDALGPQTHVIVTVRPIVRLLGSQWQQYAQNIPVPAYADWLRAIVEDPDGRSVTGSFWQRHRHDLLVERWIDLVGGDRLTVIVVDDRDHRGLPAAFEQMLSLPDGLLKPPPDKANRSLTYPEIALIRTLVERTTQPDIAAADHDRFVRFGAARGLQAVPPDPAAERLLTPSWVIDRALEIGGSMAERIGASGATIVGDLGLLSDRALAPAEGDNTPVTTIAPQAAAALAAGVISTMTRVQPGPEPRRHAGEVERAIWSRHRAFALAEAERTATASRGDIARELARRVRRRVVRRS